MATTEAMFAAGVGIPNASPDKQDRSNVDAVNANNISTYSNMSMWLESLQRGCEQAHKILGMTKDQLWFDWRFPPQTGEGGEDNAGYVERARAAVV